MVREVLGPEAGVTDENLLLHLGIVEQRANELLQARSAAGRTMQRACGRPCCAGGWARRAQTAWTHTPRRRTR